MELLINSFSLQPATDKEVIAISSSFQSGSAAGYDNISMNVVKESFNLICALLTYILICFLITGVVPKEMKIAQVIPSFKSGDNTLFTQKRPVLVVFSNTSKKQSNHLFNF